MKHRAKKSLGQNFLNSEPALNKIIEVSELVKGEFVLEIGPGKGALTKKLLSTGAKVIAVEKDDGLFRYLNQTFSKEISSDQLKIIHGDILDVEADIKTKNYKLVANIPYNITGQIIRTFLNKKNKPTKIVLMVQYEVAKRISDPEKSSLLSLSVSCFGQARFVQKVSAGSFFPKPSVDSAILLIQNISDNFFKSNKITEDLFFKVLHAGFAHKRKKLVGNLKNVWGDLNWNNIFDRLNLDKNLRAEDVDLDTWSAITKELSSLN